MKIFNVRSRTCCNRNYNDHLVPAATMLSEGLSVTRQLLRISKSSTVITRPIITKPASCQQAAAVADHGSQSLPAPKHASEIPGPSHFPIIGSFASMFFDKDFDRTRMYVYMNKLFDKYGPISILHMPGFGPMVLLANPDDSETLTRLTMDNPERPTLNSLVKIRREAADNYFEKKVGVLLENGEEWKRVRTRVQTPMMKPKNVGAYLTQMDKVALDFLDRIADFQKENGEMPATFQTEIYKWALESVGLVALNRRLGCLDPSLQSDAEAMILIREANNIIELANHIEFGGQLYRFFPTPNFLRLKKSHDLFLSIIDHNIKQTEEQLLAKESNSELTLMETLLLTPGLTRKDVVTLILDMVFAGIDTTSHALGFTLYLLARNPRCQAKLQDEIDSVLENHEGPLTSKHLGRLSYLKAVVKESLRIFPLTMGTGRIMIKDVVIGGYLIPKGYAVMTYNMHMAQDEKIFTRAKEFLPERWSRERPFGEIHPFAALPFGYGPRMCIGRRIAEQELYTFLTRAMQRYTVDFKYPDEMGVLTRMVSVPSLPLRFSFTERQR